MAFKVAGVLAVLVVAVSVATQQKEEASDEGAFGWPKDVIGVILSFFGPMEWSQLGKVGPPWTEAIPNGIAEYLRSHGTPVNTKEYKIIVCSEKKKMKDVLKSVMDKPEFRGAIFNKDECTLINHSLRGSQVCSEKGFDGRVRITGVADVQNCDPSDESKCNDIFLHRTDDFHKLHARNIRTGQDIQIVNCGEDSAATMANEKQLVIVTEYKVLIYELDWDANTAECVLRERMKESYPISSQVSTDESGDISSVLCRTVNGYDEFDIESKQWNFIPGTKHFTTEITANGKIICRGEKEISIRTRDGKTTLLEIPGYSEFYPSPDSKFVVFEISSKPCIMNLRSSEITVIPDLLHSLKIWHWISDNLFRVGQKDGSKSLRCAHNPCVDVVPFNKDDSLIRQVKVNDEVDAGDLFYNLDRIGPNLHYSFKHKKVIQVQWLNTHKH